MKSQTKQINIVFRLDDYSAISSTAMELKIIDLFRKNNSSITFGVIPALEETYVTEHSSPVEPLSAIKCDVLTKAEAEGVIEIALHGFSHKTLNPKVPSEFTGLDYQQQVSRISRGKEILKQRTGSMVTTFIPPWNRYDSNTLRALRELSFANISAGLSGDSPSDPLLNYLPESCGITQLSSAVSAAQKLQVPNPVIIVVFHLFEIKDVNARKGKITFNTFAELVNTLGKMSDIRMLSIRQAVEILDDFEEERFMQNIRRKHLINRLPRFLRPAGSYLYQ